MENTRNVTGGTTGNQEVWDNTVDAAGVASDKLESAGDKLASTANRTFDKVSDKASQAKTMLSEKYDQVKDQQGKLADEARVRVRENPMMAMRIAVAAGFLLRRLFSRSR